MKENEIKFKIKKDLYSLYYELYEIITKHQIDISKEELCDKIDTISIPQLSNYIKSLIALILKNTTSKPNNIQSPLPSSSNIPLYKYESLLHHLEKENRNLHQQIFELKFQLEIYQSSIEEYIHMEEDFEEMKQKFKYEGGKFLENDRKDNEILILHAENTKLKQLINKLETSSQEIQSKQKENETIIEKYKKEIMILKQKLQGAENELNLFSNISININNHNDISPINSALHSNKGSAKNISIKKAKDNKPPKQKKNVRYRNNSLSNLFDNQKFDIYNKYFSNKTSHSTNKKLFSDTLCKNKNNYKCGKKKKVVYNHPKLNNTTTFGLFKKQQLQRNKNLLQSGNNSCNNNSLPSYMNHQLGNNKEHFVMVNKKRNSKISTQRQVRNNSHSTNMLKNNYKYVSASFG